MLSGFEALAWNMYWPSARILVPIVTFGNLLMQYAFINDSVLLTGLVMGILVSAIPMVSTNAAALLTKRAMAFNLLMWAGAIGVVAYMANMNPWYGFAAGAAYGFFQNSMV